MSRRAHEVLAAVDTVAGYTTYIDLIRPLIEGKTIIQTAMTKEVDRVAAAIDATLDGKRCAVVSSGDPGIYAMAGLVFELCRKKGIAVHRPADPPPEGAADAVRVEVVPGIPALCAGAALLGAPLTHDFAVVSLSDLLTGWETIEKRLEAAARADFVIVIYNPRSRKRDWQLACARDIVLRHRPAATPVGIAAHAMRADQRVTVTTLGELDPEAVDMQTVIFIGSTASVRYLDFMVTPRGYARKYDMGQEPLNH